MKKAVLCMMLLLLGIGYTFAQNKAEIKFDKTPARYVRIVGKNTPALPKWHSGAGKKAYMFIDEIEIF